MIQYIALAALILASLSYVNSQATCGDSPVLPLLEKFIQSHDTYVNNPNSKNKKDDDKTFDGDSLLATFKASTGAAVDDLEICKDYNSGGNSKKLTCCTNDLVKLFPRLTKGFFRRRMGKPPKPFQLASKKCGVSDYEGIYARKEAKDIMKTFEECQKNAILADVDLLRGTLCSLCVAPNDYATYFQTDSQDAENLKIMVNSENIKAYNSAMQANLKCLDDAQASITAYVNNITSTWDNSTCQADNERKYRVKKRCQGKSKTFLELDGDDQEDDYYDYPEQAGIQPQGKQQQQQQRGGNREFVSLQRILRTCNGGFVESVSGLNNVYSVDSIENGELAEEEIERVLKYINNNFAQNVTYAMGLLVALLSFILI